MASKALIGSVVMAAAALVLVVTNPSATDFKERMGGNSGILARLTCTPVETSNYVVFSRYEYRCLTTTDKYLGVLGNYFQIDNKDGKETA